MGNSNKSVQKKSTNSPKKINKNLQLLPELPDMYIPLESGIVQHPDQSSLKIYTILMNKNQLQTYKSSLAFRKKYPQQLIQILYGEMLQDQKQYYKLRVYLQHIQYTLQQFRNIHFYDLMAIFHKVFKGFKHLYENFGCFDVDPRMIGFNEQAEVKVWCNIKYSRPIPKQAYQILDEKKMIQNLIQIFMNKVDITTIPINSKSRKFKLEAQNFDEAIKTIEDQVQSVDLIPKNINSIKNLMTSGRKIHENQNISMNSELFLKGLQKTIKFSYSNPSASQQTKFNQKISFTFGRSQSLGIPKSNSSHSKPKITFNNKPVQQQSNNSHNNHSRITFTSHNPSSVNQLSRISNLSGMGTFQKKINDEEERISKSGSTKTIKKPLRNNSQVKFTYN